MPRMIPLPSAFVERMRALLGAEAGPFFASLLAAPALGLRLNRIKLAALPPELASWQLQPVPWCPEGFVVAAAAVEPGKHPLHAAGAFYLQDPSAMAAAHLLDPQPGECVLDLAAAPGGKATHLAAQMQGRGLLVANEVGGERVAALIENLERCGVTQALVLQEKPETLAGRWPGRFDRVLVDAPCSGEGMFRKSEAARQEWRPQRVTGCALRQRGILAAAAHLLRPGGRLLYATCTFAPEENEATVAAFLRSHADFTLLAPPALPGFDPGRPDWIDPELAHGLPLQRCVRLWPHRSGGEGHFFALFQRQGEAPPAVLPAPATSLPQPTMGRARAFWQETLIADPPRQGWAQYGDWLHLLPVDPAFWQGLRVLRAGLRVARLAPGHMQPHPALALSLQARQARHCLDLAAEGAEIAAYLRGETLAAAGPDGWTLLTVRELGLGWGKRVQGVLKNHYPKGWRRR